MKSIIKSLNALADKIDTEGASDVKPDYKNPNYSIVKALTRIADVFDAGGSSEVVPEYKNPNNSIETALKRIADNYSAESGGGGGSSLKSISITNELSYSISVVNYLDENGKFVYPSSSADYLRIEAGGTTTVYYPEPAEGSFWLIYLGSPNIAIQDEVTGVELDGNEILIYPSADNEVSITIVASAI